MASSVISRMSAFMLFSLFVLGDYALSVEDPLSAAAQAGILSLDQAEWLSGGTDPIPGFKPLYGIQERVLDVSKRDCLPNGTNFCFGDNVNSCPSCGTCCTPGTYCCSSTQTCCGGGCCKTGESCSASKCVPTSTPTTPVVTATTTVLTSVTRLVTQVATVLVAEVSTSTVFSTVEVTVTDAATQTNVVWVTMTAGGAAKRTASPDGLTLAHDVDLEERDSIPSFPVVLQTLRSAWGALAPGAFSDKLTHLVDDLAPVRRADPPATSTTTVVVTQTTVINNIISTTVSAATTSIAQTTIFETVTRALNAKFTTTVTSTLTVTPRAPVTQTVTNTASVIISQTNSVSSTTSTTAAGPAPTDSSPSTALTTPAIAGIAAGSAAAVIIIVGVLAFWWFRRRKNKNQDAWNNDPTHSYLAYDPELPAHGSSGMQEQYRQPTLPRISFTPNPAHHSVQFQPPAPGAGATAQSAVPSGELAATEASPVTRHHRSSSGFTTLVSAAGTPSPAPAGGKKNDNGRVSVATVGSQTLRGSRLPSELASVNTPSLAEADGAEARRWFEVDAMNGLAVGELEEHPQQAHEPGQGYQQQGYAQQQHHGQGWAQNVYQSQELEGHPYVTPGELDAAPQGEVPPQYHPGYQYPPNARGARHGADEH